MKRITVVVNKSWETEGVMVTDYYIHLPNELSDQLSMLKSFRINQGFSDESLLLSKTNGAPVTA